MESIVWKYTSQLRDVSVLDDLERNYSFVLPLDLKRCIAEHNAGVPSKYTFDLKKRKGMVFGGLLSFNKNDMDSIFDYIELFKTNDGKYLTMLPFASDPAGNFFCIQNNKVVLYLHEEDRTILLCDSFSDLLNMLY